MKRPRGLCPVCERELGLRDDRTLPEHNVRAGTSKTRPSERCDGSGQHPDDQLRVIEATT
jgi:hypothetical protein